MVNLKNIFFTYLFISIVISGYAQTYDQSSDNWIDGVNGLDVNTSLNANIGGWLNVTNHIVGHNNT